MCSAKKSGYGKSNKSKTSLITEISTFFPILPPYAASSSEAYLLWDSVENLILDINDKALEWTQLNSLSHPIPLDNIWEKGAQVLLKKLKSDLKKESFPIDCGKIKELPGSPGLELFPFSHKEQRYFVLKLLAPQSAKPRIQMSNALQALDSMPGFAYQVKGDMDGKFVSLQSGLKEFFPKPAYWIGKNWQSLKKFIHPEDWESYKEELQQHIQENKSWKLNYRMIQDEPDSETWILESGTRYQDQEGNWIMEALALDISEYKAESHKYQTIAMHDALTGLPNRILFLDRLSQSLAKARRTEWPFAVFFIDLDDFKAINDQHGHAAGDEVLVAVSERLKNCLRETDTVARISGDEFTILLENTQHKNYSEIVAHKLQEALSKAIPLHNKKEVHLSASIGICPYFKGDNANILLQKADSAMYMAKKSGKSKHYVYGQLLQQAP